MIAGNRVRLRPVGEADLPLLHAWFDTPDVMRYWAKPAVPVTDRQFRDDLQGRFARFDDAGYFIIEVRDRGAIGRDEFERLDRQARSAEVMILIGEPTAWGQGYGTDAMVALLRYLFHARNLHRVALSVLAWNERAIRSYRKVGFVEEGRLRDDAYDDGRYHDQIVMGILRPEFDARWPATPGHEPGGHARKCAPVVDRRDR